MLFLNWSIVHCEYGDGQAIDGEFLKLSIQFSIINEVNFVTI